VRSIAKEISAADSPQTVKIYAYKNGDGRQKEGQLIIGSSIIGVRMTYCFVRLLLLTRACTAHSYLPLENATMMFLIECTAHPLFIITLLSQAYQNEDRARFHQTKPQ